MPESDRIDRYEIEGILGRGSMGVVYRARDPVIGRLLALKTIHRGDESSPGNPGERFIREMRTAGILSHPNIVTVYDAGVLGDDLTSFIAMELVEGRTLRQRIPSGERIPPGEVLDLALQVARALDYAHGRGVVHRDVKPANILIRDDGLIKITDFGIAQLGVSEMSAAGESFGSPSYIAPECLQSQPVDGRADLFSLGVVLYEALTGAKPFRGDNLAALCHAIVSIDPVVPSVRAAGIPAAWDKILLGLLAKRPGDRYAGAAELIEDLRRMEQGWPPAGPIHEAEEDPLERTIKIPAQDRGADAPGVQQLILPAHGKAMLALATVGVFAVALILAAAAMRGAAEAVGRQGDTVAVEPSVTEPPAGAVSRKEQSARAPGRGDQGSAPREAIVETETRAEPRPPAVEKVPDRDAPATAVAEVVASGETGSAVREASDVSTILKEETVPDPAPRISVDPTVPMKVRLGHNLGGGRLTVALDGETVLDHAFESESGRRMRVREVITKSIDVPRGDHRFEVRIVDSRGRRWAQSLEGDLQDATTLNVDIGGAFRRKMRVSWE